jgi:hypothetical protein
LRFSQTQRSSVHIPKRSRSCYRVIEGVADRAMERSTPVSYPCAVERFKRHDCGVLERFVDDDAGYLAWLRGHPRATSSTATAARAMTT